MFEKENLKKTLSENLPLLCILIGIVLVSLAIGPFQNGDTVWEYKAASGVIRWGMPYVEVAGSLMNQPPLGFYIEAGFFRVFGQSIDIGVVLVTLFGLGSTVLVYKIGKYLYSKNTGLFATAIFGLTPWELVLSRTFLIDAQCLFFSLLCLYVGIVAMRKNSVKLSIVAGVFFAAAILTKFFAAFILIPLLLLYVYYRPKKAKVFLSQLVAFAVPVLLFVFLWYQVISGKGILYLFQHSDFSDLNVNGVVPSYSFVSTFLVNYGLGYFFIGAIALSFLICFLFRKRFSKIVFYDLIFLITIIFILSLNTFLGAALNLRVPYTSAIKYDYQALPFFSLAAASVLGKTFSLFKSAVKKASKIPLLFALSAGLFLMAATLFTNFYSANQLATSNYLLFRVRMDDILGYSFFNSTPTSANSPLIAAQYLGFVLVLFGLAWAVRHQLHSFFSAVFKPMNRWIEAKNASYRAQLTQA